MTDRITPEREQEIRARLDAVGEQWASRRDLSGRYAIVHGPRVSLTEGFTEDGNVAYLERADGEARTYQRARLIADAPTAQRDLLAEVDRLRGALREACDYVAEQDDKIGELSAENHALKAEAERLAREKGWLDRHYAKQIEESVRLRDELQVAQEQFNEPSREMSAVSRERDDALAAALREAADEVTADLEQQGGDATGQYAVGMKRAALRLRRRADEIGGA